MSCFFIDSSHVLNMIFTIGFLICQSSKRLRKTDKLETFVFHQFAFLESHNLRGFEAIVNIPTVINKGFVSQKGSVGRFMILALQL